MSLLILLFLPLLLLSRCLSGHKIAIIGGGVGGAANSYFLKQLLGDNAEITVFERNDVPGGRLSGVKMGDRAFDSGGSIIHSKNKHAKALTELVGLSIENLSGSNGVGFYDGSQYVLKLAGGVTDKLKILRRYGFGVKKLVDHVEKYINELDRIYCLQSNKVSFRSVADLLNSTHPDLLSSTQHSMRDHLNKLGVSELLQNELVTASIHTNYNQDLDVSAIVGLISLAGGTVGSLWRVEGGNFLLPSKILSHIKARLVTGDVSQVKKAEGVGFDVVYTSGGDSVRDSFDAVVIATPLHDADIKLPRDVMPQQFQRTVATFVSGELANIVPGVENPGDILTVATKQDLLFTSIGFKGEGKEGKIYKIFSKERVTDSQIERMFEKVDEVKVVDWKAYPKYATTKSLPDFELMPGLYHINAIEAAASAIEMSCIGSKNVALLVYQYLEKVENVKFESVCSLKDMKKYRHEL